MGIWCDKNGHRMGKVYNEKDEKYTICKFPGCGEKVLLKQMGLGEVDDLSLEKTGSSNNPKKKRVKSPRASDEIARICRRDGCGGKLFKVSPEREMSKKFLHECVRCHEREYVK